MLPSPPNPCNVLQYQILTIIPTFQQNTPAILLRTEVYVKHRSDGLATCVDCIWQKRDRNFAFATILHAWLLFRVSKDTVQVKIQTRKPGFTSSQNPGFRVR